MSITSQKLREIQAPFKLQYRENPESALQTLAAHGEIDLSTLSVKMPHSGPSWEQTGMHPLTGGDGQFACAAEMLLYSLAGCAGVTFAAVATAMEIPIQSAKLTVSGELDFRGTLGVSRVVPVGFTSVRIEFQIDSTATDEQLAKLTELAERYCVVAQTLKSVSATWVRQ